MKYDERVMLLRDWEERLSDLVEVDMWDALCNRFRVRSKSKPQGSMEQSSAEAYANAVRSIYCGLQEQIEGLTLLRERAERDADMSEYASRMFSAWEVGLCPAAVKAHPELRQNMYYELTLEEIASYRNVSGLNYADTERAIEIWKSQTRRPA